ncbi:MAG: dTMP kinase [Candidatus Deianiraeaceae bacterium]|jgi:dTMP kinase
MQGKFIVLDGCDFTGKTTQCNKIASYFARNYNIKNIITREPGGTQFGEQIREIILENGKKLHPYSELLLFMSARSEHIFSKITPMLEQGISVICDRYIASTFVYQGILREVPHQNILTLHQNLFNNLKPDITFILDMDPEIILKRMQEVEFKGCNNYDSKTIEDITKIRNGFLEFTKTEECHIINANNKPDDVFEGIMTKLKEVFKVL